MRDESDELRARAREHVIFSGNLDRSKPGFGERLIARAVHAPRDGLQYWEETHDRARHIAAEPGG